VASKEEEQRIVTNLSIVMLGKLRANGWKSHWREGVASLDANGDAVPRAGEQKEQALKYLQLLKYEVEELERELQAPAVEIHPAKVMQECADVANMAAMIADIICFDSPDAPRSDR